MGTIIGLTESQYRELMEKIKRLEAKNKQLKKIIEKLMQEKTNAMGSNRRQKEK
ncbi:MAG: hypothetical protein ACYDDB_04195 [bacterium]